MTSRLALFFGEGFRVFFFAAGAFGFLSMLVWVMWLGVHYLGPVVSEMPFAMPAHQWHAHEMIFGYAGAALGGFLLTAVPNWTGSQAARHRFITASAGIWLAGRLAIWCSGTLPLWLVAGLDLAFLPILAVKIGSQLWHRPKPQNVMFLLFIAMIWVANLMVHLQWLGLTEATLDAGMRGGLLGICAMIAVLGGRVTPGFTRNAMKRAGVSEDGWPVVVPLAEKAALALAIVLPLAVLTGLPAAAVGGLAVLAGAVQLLRIARWKWRWTLNQPILLALHLGMAMLGAGLILWGLSLLGTGSEVAALHILGIGAVGGMTLAVMSRAVLGHTGRPLVAPAPVAAGYLMLAAAAVLRWLASTLPAEWYFPLVLASGVLWVAVFLLYSVSIWPAVTNVRLPSRA
ncbi:NnrS family protein [Fluviibacterium sp. DFM31]|uniref:NnrS family protein n=1 Tax=Meridianimarinicoccus marinus TaxID=3231483 RepID=A0ABV3L9P7_9RHOB